MASRNAEVVRELYAGWTRGDFRVGLEHYAPEVDFTSEFGVDRVHGRGFDAMRRLWGDQLRNWDDWHTGEIQELHELPEHDCVLVLNSVHGRGRNSGIAVELPRAVCAFRFRDGKIVWLLASDRLEVALEALGLSEESLDVGTGVRARRIMADLSRRDVDALLEASHPDVEWRSFFAIGEGGVYRGEEGTRRYVSDLDDAFEDVGSEVDDVLAVGDVALVVGRIAYRGKGSGVEAARPAGWVLTFRDGKLASFRAFRDPEAALQVMGLEA